MHATLPLLLESDFPAIRRRLETMQVNLGYVCNQSCLHCHVDAGPTRTESMTAETVEQVLAFLAATGARVLELPEARPSHDLGYGREGTGLVLNLVYNPQGASLPPPQDKLEADYKRVLGESFGIVFNSLYTIANMPIKRFGSTLVSKGQCGPYMRLLRGAHRDENLDGVMCRSLVSVDWQGYMFDCDFYQMLGLPLRLAGKGRPHLTDLVGRDLEGNPIVVRDHCYGCTAGQGSSCGGTL